jgi:sec-independent protein translocase protein TatC
VHRQYNEDLFESSKMTFGEHLDELRATLVKSILSFVIGFLIALIFAGRLVDYVQTPLRSALKEYYGTMAERGFRNSLTDQGNEGEETAKSAADAAKRLRDQGLEFEERWVSKQEINKLQGSFFPKTEAKPPIVAANPDAFLQPDDLLKMHIYRRLDDDPRIRVIGLRVDEPFVVYMKAAVMLGAILASPFIFYFIWQFVAAGLYPHEQRYVHIFLPFSLGLFLAGAALAFFGVFQFVLRFFFSFSGWMGIELEPRITDWLSFVLILPLGFGIAFQLPLVMLFLERIGIFTVASYLASWRISVLVIAFLAMLFTPSDPYSMMLMMTPLIGLYFFGILLCQWMPRRVGEFADAVE